MKKYIPILISVLVSFQGKSQKAIDMPCPTDTVRGILYYQGQVWTNSEVIEGYYIAKCGGYQVCYYCGDTPTFIPAFFIRNDEIVNGRRQVDVYHKQMNTGYFTDSKFNKIPINAIYGLLVNKPHDKTLNLNSNFRNK